MSNETDLDWLARNVHEWPAGEHQPWCYVYMTYGGVMKAAGNFLDAGANPAMITIDQWISRRAELQNKPSWSKAEEWAEWLAQDSYGCWGFFQKKPLMHALSWIARSGYYQIHSPGNLLLGDWRDTLEKRPEQNELEPFVSIEDSQEKEMKQDNKWFERGELPPVGEICEIHHSCWNESKFEKVKIAAITKDYLIVEYATFEQHYLRKDMSFRSLRTERDKEIDEMVGEFIDHYGDPKGGERHLGIAEKLYDAGYRKEVK